VSFFAPRAGEIISAVDETQAAPQGYYHATRCLLPDCFSGTLSENSSRSGTGRWTFTADQPDRHYLSSSARLRRSNTVFERSSIPHFDRRFAARGRESVAVGAESDRGTSVETFFEFECFETRQGVPDPDGTVDASRVETVAVEAKVDALEDTRVTAACKAFLSGSDVLDLHRPTVASR
jgi:hypothetical protein